MLKQLLKFGPLAILLAVTSNSVAGELSPGLQDIIKKGISFTRCHTASVSFEDSAEKFSKFFTTLGEVDSVITNQENEWAASNEGSDIRAKLIVIAREYAVKKSLFDEVNEKYFLRPQVPVAPQPQVWIGPEPELSFARDHRLVFEGLLLAAAKEPEVENAAEMAARAIGRAADQRSLILLDFLYGNALNVNKYGNENLQCAIVGGLLEIPSERTLSILLTRLTQTAQKSPYQKSGINDASKWDKIRAFYQTRKRLLDIRSDGDLEKFKLWKSLIDRHSETLTPSEKSILVDLRKIVSKP